MKAGKIIAIICGVALIAIMVLMISSEAPAPGPKPEPEKAAPIAQKTAPEPKKSLNLIDDEEIKNIERLKEGAKERKFEVSKLYLVSCAPCHGDDGRGKIAPPINGKSKETLLASLRDYKAGKIKNSLMSGLLTNTSEATLDALADEISKFKE